MHGTHHSACFGCNSEQSRCKKLHQVLGSPWEHQQFGENECTDIGNCQRLKAEGNAKINKASAMRPGSAKNIEKVLISRHFQRPETDFHIAENAWCTQYADTRLSKWVHWLCKSQSTNHRTTKYLCENKVDLNNGSAWASLPIMRIHPPVGQESILYSLPAARHNSGWMDFPQVHLGSSEAIPIRHPLDVEQAYGYSTSTKHCVQWHVQSYGWLYVSLR